MFEEILEYKVKTCPITESGELESILNSMAQDGWSLYMLNEAENEDGDFVHNCIFHRRKQDEKVEDADVIEISDFKSRVEQIFDGLKQPYESCVELQQQLSEKKKQIEYIKRLLETEEDEENKATLNDNISRALKELHGLKKELSRHIDPEKMYRFIGQNKLTILLSDELLPLVQNEKELLSQTVKLRQKLALELGYVVPSVKFIGSDELLENEYRICIRGVCVLSGFAYPGYVKYFSKQLNLSQKPKGAMESQNPFNKAKEFWLKEKNVKDYWEKGLHPAEAIVEALEKIAIDYVDEILDYEDVNHYLEIVGAKNFFLVENLLSDYLTIGDLRKIFCRLIAEKVSVRDIIYLVEKINDIIHKGINIETLIAKLRTVLKNNVFKTITIEDGIFYGVELSKKLQLELVEESKTEKSIIITKLKKELCQELKENNTIVLLAPIELRAELFYKLDRIIPVVSAEEIPEGINFKAIKKLKHTSLKK